MQRATCYVPIDRRITVRPLP